MEHVVHEGSLTQVKSRGRTRTRRDEVGLFCSVPTALLIMFIVIPLVALIWRAAVDPAFWPSMTKPVVREALWVTLLTTTATLLVSVVCPGPSAFSRQVARRNDYRFAARAAAGDGGSGAPHGLWTPRCAGPPAGNPRY